MDTYSELLDVTYPLRESVIRSAVQAMNPPPASRGLDVGCGIGLQTILLAEAVGPDGHITGLDLSPDLLAQAKVIVQKAGLSPRISFREGDANTLPFDQNTFDWAWSVDCVGYAPFDPLPALKEMIRVVKPGGIVALMAWSSEKLLPGYPLLEAHLNATTAGIAPFVREKDPRKHFLRALGWFHESGLQQSTTQTFVGGAHAPLSHDLRRALTALLDMRWPGVEQELTGEDWAEYQRLCRPESPDFILNLPAYAAFFTYTLFSGKVPS